MTDKEETLKDRKSFSKGEENKFLRGVLKWKSPEDVPSEKIVSLFNRLNIYPGDGKSYFVKGDRKQLKDFENYYRLLAALDVSLSFRSPCKFQIYRYANKLTYGDEDGKSWYGTDEDLLILTEGKHAGGREATNTEDWLKTTIVKHVENRKNCNQVTLILSERDMPLIKAECGTVSQPKDACLMAYVNLIEYLGHSDIKVARSVVTPQVEDTGNRVSSYD